MSKNNLSAQAHISEQMGNTLFTGEISFETLGKIIPTNIIEAAKSDIKNIKAMIEAQRGGVWDTFEAISNSEENQELNFPQRMAKANEKATKTQDEIDAALKGIGETDSADKLIENWLKELPADNIRAIAKLAEPDMPYYDNCHDDSGYAWVAVRAIARSM